MDGALMVHGAMGNVMVVGGQVLGERGVEVSSGVSRRPV